MDLCFGVDGSDERSFALPIELDVDVTRLRLSIGSVLGVVGFLERPPRRFGVTFWFDCGGLGRPTDLRVTKSGDSTSCFGEGRGRPAAFRVTEFSVGIAIVFRLLLILFCNAFILRDIVFFLTGMCS